jgi:hypothetical protein
VKERLLMAPHIERGRAREERVFRRGDDAIDDGHETRLQLDEDGLRLHWADRHAARRGSQAARDEAVRIGQQ